MFPGTRKSFDSFQSFAVLQGMSQIYQLLLVGDVFMVMNSYRQLFPKCPPTEDISVKCGDLYHVQLDSLTDIGNSATTVTGFVGLQQSAELK